MFENLKKKADKAKQKLSESFEKHTELYVYGALGLITGIWCFVGYKQFKAEEAKQLAAVEIMKKEETQRQLDFEKEYAEIYQPHFEDFIERMDGFTFKSGEYIGMGLNPNNGYICILHNTANGYRTEEYIQENIFTTKGGQDYGKNQN